MAHPQAGDRGVGLGAGPAGAAGNSGVAGGIDCMGATSSPLTTGNTLIAKNLAAGAASDVLCGAVTSQGHNLIGSVDGSSPWNASDLTGTAASPLDPKLAPLANNGGSTPTMALLPASPAIDHGSNALVLAAGLATDQRGFVRIFNGTVDIGAYESGSAFPGDVNRDGTVGFVDLLTLAQNYGKTNASWAQGDFNGDGSVGFDDLLILAQNYGRTVPRPLAPVNPAAANSPLDVASADSEALRARRRLHYAIV